MPPLGEIKITVTDEARAFIARLEKIQVIGEENKELREKDARHTEALSLILDIARDHAGFSSAEDLGALVDEIAKIAKAAGTQETWAAFTANMESCKE